MSEVGFIPDWPVPAQVKSFVTYRTGGHSRAPYQSNNLALHVGDDPEQVIKNREALAKTLQLKTDPLWLEQVHGTELVRLDINTQHLYLKNAPALKADGCIATGVSMPCVVMTADCLPLLFADEFGRQVAAIHCGWKGLAAGLISKTLKHFDCDPAELIVYLGPAISQKYYEVSADVELALAKTAPSFSVSQAVAGKPNHYLLDLYAVAKAQLQLAGVTRVFGGDRCVFQESDYFYSYRREGVTGRMASLVWIE